MSTNESGFKSTSFQPSKFILGTRRGNYYDIESLLTENTFSVDPKLVSTLNRADTIYRTLCGILFNYVPTSGHPGGSISSGRIVQSLQFHTMDYDISDPDALDADQLCYAAGHRSEARGKPSRRGSSRGRCSASRLLRRALPGCRPRPDCRQRVCR